MNVKLVHWSIVHNGQAIQVNGAVRCGVCHYRTKTIKLSPNSDFHTAFSKNRCAMCGNLQTPHLLFSFNSCKLVVSANFTVFHRTLEMIFYCKIPKETEPIFWIWNYQNANVWSALTSCLNQCTYCKTKHARGELGSYSPADIINRAQQSFEGLLCAWFYCVLSDFAIYSVCLSLSQWLCACLYYSGVGTLTWGEENDVNYKIGAGCASDNEEISYQDQDCSRLTAVIVGNGH